MTDARLIPCPDCARHVRATEVACPFCSAALPVTQAARAWPRSTGTRLSRAALFALGASAAAVAACGGETNGDATDGGVVADASQDRMAPVYGAPPHDRDSGDPLPKKDAGSEEAGDASDAAAEDAAADAEGGPPKPPYGAPPP